MQGRVWKFGDFISTDLIAPGRYFYLRSNLSELAKHVLEDANPDFAKNVKKGDIVVAGKNFGMGSSREHAPIIMKMAGVSVIIAESFSRIFFRNAINIGLLAITLKDTSMLKQDDTVSLNLSTGEIINLTNKQSLIFNPLPSFMLDILEDGGVIKHVIKNKGFRF